MISKKNRKNKILILKQKKN